MQAIKELFKQLIGIWKELGLNQKITVSATTLAVVAGVVSVLVWSGRTEYSLLYGNLDPSEAGKVTQALEENNVEYKIGGSGGTVFVPRSEVHQMRMKLAIQGIPKGEVRDQFVTGTDWFPTLAEWTGAKIPKGHHLDGQSIAKVIKNPKASTPHQKYYWQLGNRNNQWVVREGEWKLYAKARENVRPKGIPEMTKEDKKHFLVNLSKDPGEKRNWAKDHPAELKRLQELAKKYQDDLASSAK